MSLILEALKKLEREKEAPQRGFLVVAPASWPSRSQRLAVPMAVGAVVLVVAGAGYFMLRMRSRTVVANDARPTAAAPAAAPAGLPAVPASSANALAPPATQVPQGTLPAAVRVDPPTAPLPNPTERALVDFGRPTAVRTPSSRPAGAPANAAASSQTPAAAGANPDAAPAGAAVPAAPVLEITHAAPPPTAAAPKGLDALHLEAISSQDGHPVAILSGRLVREGETLDGVRVIRIGTDEVELEHNGRRRTLRF
jgi:hypothetical protein